jgi:hypothetical protein
MVSTPNSASFDLASATQPQEGTTIIDLGPSEGLASN